MGENRRVLRIFVAGASDVSAEVRAVMLVAEEMNRGIAAEKGLSLETLWWRTHVAPAMGEPEKVILRQIWPEDIFVGILFGRFGTPTAEADSGTEEEFKLAYKLWAASGGELGGRPRIMMYFRQARQHIRTPEEAEQKNNVLLFRDSVKRLGLVWEYRTPLEFERALREHFTRILREWPKAGANPVQEVSLEHISKEFRRRRDGKDSAVAVVFTDIVGFTRLNLLLGRELCDRLGNTYSVTADRLISEHGGFLVRAHGDEILAVFPAVPRALHFAGKFTLVTDDLSAEAGHKVPVRVGISAKVMNLRNVNIFWKEAKRAAAIAKLAPDGQVYATIDVATICRKHLPVKGMHWHDHGSASYGPFRFDHVLEVLYPGSQRRAVPPRETRRDRFMIVPGGIFGSGS